MSIRLVLTRPRFSRACFSVLTLAFVAFLGLLASQAQQRINKRYPAGRNVRIELKNISGTITVESWNRDEIKLLATLESPAAKLLPRATSDGLVVDVMGDNRGRGEVGNVSFKLQVPVGATVDLETRQGDIRVSNIRGNLVRAHVSSEGSIELNGIVANQVIAQNTMGDIYFDGEFSRNGSYHFKSGQGNITIRIPADSAFKVVASSQARKIALGQFWNDGFKNLGDGRKYEGDVRNGHASVTVTNFQGSITFMRR
ncbi:MAG: DUF4097 family beta strand repeat-containing protein [Pyrinomonadaceae bacterium]